MAEALVTIEEAGRALGVSRSTVWRLIQRGKLLTVRRGGRRLVQSASLRTRASRRPVRDLATFSTDHPIFRLVGAGRSGGRKPGAREKHAILDE